MTSKLGNLFRPVSECMVLLSATPIQLRSRDLFQLLNLVDESTFDRQDSFGDILEANRPLVRASDIVRRGSVLDEAGNKRDINLEDILTNLREAQLHPLLRDNRQLKHLLETPPTNSELIDRDYRAYLANRFEKINLLGHAVTRTRKRDVHSIRVVRDVIPEEIETYNTEIKLIRDNFMVKTYNIITKLPKYKS